MFKIWVLLEEMGPSWLNLSVVETGLLSTSCKWFRADESLCSHLFFTFATRKAVILSNNNPCVYILCIYLLYIVYIYRYWEVSKTLVLPTIYIFGAWPRGHPRPLSVAPKNSTARRLIQKPMERMVIQESWWRYNPCFRGSWSKTHKGPPFGGSFPIEIYMTMHRLWWI